MFADLKQLYILVIRQNTTLQTDPYTAGGFCTSLNSRRGSAGNRLPERGKAFESALMRDHYHGFAHPILVDIPVEAPSDLISEMHIIADELRTNPEHIISDDQIAFRDLQRRRRPDHDNAEFFDLFAVWRDHYRARCAIKESERRARIEQLSKQREELFAERAMARPPQHASLTARLLEIGRELAELQPKFSGAPLGEWINSRSRV